LFSAQSSTLLFFDFDDKLEEKGQLFQLGGILMTLWDSITKTKRFDVLWDVWFLEKRCIRLLIANE